LKQLFLAMAHYMRPYWLSVSFIFFAITVQMGFRLALPFAFQLTFDNALPHRNLAYLFEILGVLCIWWVIQAALALVQDIRAAKTGIAVVNDLRSMMFAKIQNLPTDYFSRKASGDIVSRFSVDLAALENASIEAIYVFFFSCFNVLASLLLLFYIDWQLAALTLVGLVLSSMGPKRLSGQAEKKSYERKNQEGELNGFVQELLAALEVIHAFNLWAFMRKKFGGHLKRFETKAMRSHSISAIMRRMGGQSAALLQVMILAVGGFLVIEGDLTIGTLVGFLALLQNMIAGTSHLAGVIPPLLQASGAMTRVKEFLMEQGEQVKEKVERPLPRMERSLAFEDLDFGYGGQDPVLRGLSFTIEKGESVAIVGPSGSGKSTLLKLLLRFYDPDRGSIRWDGADVRDFSKTSLRGQVSVVPQDSFLFDESVRENIRMGCLDASEEDILAAAKNAELHQLVTGLPDGYETRVGERGSHLSGGQRQRVAIARAILGDPALLVLDEATSALDPMTERSINDTLMKISGGHTLISVTHRLNTVTAMDRILVMQNGRVVQQGSHGQLLEKKGLYADLWRKQSGFTISDDGFRAECSPQRLKLIPLFQNLEFERLKHISGLLVSEYFPKDHLVFEKGTTGEKFYIIVNGQVEVIGLDCGDEDCFHSVLDSGDIFGELALLDHVARSATVKTMMPSLFLTLDKYEFRHLLQENPDIGEAIEDVARLRRTHVRH